MDMSARISEVCKRSNDAARGVMPPQVCRFCMICPIGTIVTGVTNGNPQVSALPIPDENAVEVKAWLDKVERKILQSTR